MFFDTTFSIVTSRRSTGVTTPSMCRATEKITRPSLCWVTEGHTHLTDMFRVAIITYPSCAGPLKIMHSRYLGPLKSGTRTVSGRLNHVPEVCRAPEITHPSCVGPLKIPHSYCVKSSVSCCSSSGFTEFPMCAPCWTGSSLLRILLLCCARYTSCDEGQTR